MADEWREFEKRVQNESDLKGYLCLQFPVENRIIKGGLAIKVKSKPDFLIAVGGRAILLDAKSTQEERWNLKKYVFSDTKGSRKIHQWEKLLEAHEKGVVAGYLVWFKNHGRVVWASVPYIQELAARGEACVTPYDGVSVADDQPIDIGKLAL